MPLADVATHLPKLTELCGQLQAWLHPTRLSLAPGKRCPQILMFSLQAAYPCQLLRPAQPRIRRLRQCQKVVQMALADSGLLTGRPQPLGAVLPDGFEQPVARILTKLPIHHDE